MNHKFRLEPYKGRQSRYKCPSCGRLSFTRYIDESGQYLNSKVGRCDHEQKCGYHYPPGEYFRDTGQDDSNIRFSELQKAVKLPRTIPDKVVKRSIGNYKINSFYRYLERTIGKDQARKQGEKYLFGTTKQGETIFWFIDINGITRAGQVKSFDESGHTIKGSTTWIHSLMKKYYRNKGKQLPEWLRKYIFDDTMIVSCMYGEHLLREYSDQPVALVEAPATAIVADACIPGYNWLAVGSLSYLSRERCSALAGRDVTLFPDAGALEIWTNKSANIPGNISISRMVEEFAGPEDKGIDLRDVLDMVGYKIGDKTPKSDHDQPEDKEGPGILDHPMIKKLIERFDLEVTSIQPIT